MSHKIGFEIPVVIAALDEFLNQNLRLSTTTPAGKLMITRGNRPAARAKLPTPNND